MPTETDQAFVKRLIAVRLAYGAMTGRPNLSRSVFAFELGMEREAYRRWERGETNPQVDGFRRLRDLTGISLDYLICGAIPGYVDPHEFCAECTVPFAVRLTWVRELYCTGEEAAYILRVPFWQWDRYEKGIDPMPLEVMREFAHRFSVSMPYLLRGLPNDVAPPVLAELRRLHPTLWREGHKRKGRRRGRTAPKVVPDEALG